MKIWLSLLLLFFGILLFADEPESAWRSFDQEALERYKSDPAFDYSSDYDKSGSWLTLMFIYLLEKLSRIFSFGESLWILPYIFRALAIIILLVVLYYILKNRFGITFERDGSKLKSAPIVLSAEDKVNYDKLLKEALDAQSYKLAIRYQFLKTLQMLHQKGRIKIAHWKAPTDYLYEIKSEDRQGFKSIVEIFEATWYGDYAAEESTYQTVLAKANDLLNEKR